MKIRIEEKSGFCYGVIRAVAMADAILDKGEPLFCLGQIVHNEMEVKRLEIKGLKTITREDIPLLHNCKMLVRAHGEPPSTYEIAKKNNIEIIDGTCPIVRKIQSGIVTRAKEEDALIVIYGKKGHPEVEGLYGQSPEKSLIISSLEEVDSLPVTKNLHLYSQTTMDSEAFQNIIINIKNKQIAEGGKLVVHNTICSHVSHRKPGLQKFASENDLIIFVGGKHSSNGKMLYQACKDINVKSYYISFSEDLQSSWFEGIESVGIAGATSTPRRQIDEVANRINEICIFS
jgi:4-hydroxy-3-methylbut-2-enyl diphosphate reductase